MKILACGPFIGDFSQEILTFRPYCHWLQKVVEHDRMYISTHGNRFFLYDFLPEKYMVPVYWNLSRDELGQKGYVHEDMPQKDYNILIRKFKDDIAELSNCNKKDIIHYNINYIKSTPSYPIWNKHFEKIKIPDIDIHENNRVVFIPYSEESEEKLFHIYEFIRDNYNGLVIGDKRIQLDNYNRIKMFRDYFENGWKYIMKYIHNAIAVICPVSFWTAICNLQGIPVFSWGEQISQYKENGMYFFGNEKSMVVSSYEDTEMDSIIKSLKHFLEAL